MAVFPVYHTVDITQPYRHAWAEIVTINGLNLARTQRVVYEGQDGIPITTKGNIYDITVVLNASQFWEIFIYM